VKAAKLEELILELSTECLSPVFFLRPQQFEELINEIKPLYESRYGGLIADKEMSELGYLNVLYKGVPVCMEKEEKVEGVCNVTWREIRDF